MNKKVFVTGGGGFIGSHLVEKLVQDGFSVKTIVPYNIDNSWGWLDHIDKKIKDNVEIILGDISDQNLIHKETKKVNKVVYKPIYLIFWSLNRSLSSIVVTK